MQVGGDEIKTVDIVLLYQDVSGILTCKLRNTGQNDVVIR